MNTMLHALSHLSGLMAVVGRFGIVKYLIIQISCAVNFHPVKYLVCNVLVALGPLNTGNMKTCIVSIALCFSATLVAATSPLLQRGL